MLGIRAEPRTAPAAVRDARAPVGRRLATARRVVTRYAKWASFLPEPAPERVPPPAPQPPPAVPPPAPITAEPVALLLVAGDAVVGTRWIEQRVADIAALLAHRARSVIVVDLADEGAGLAAAYGADGAEGLSDLLLFGASLHHVARAVPGQPFHVVGAGPGRLDREQLAAHPRWPRLFAEARRRDQLLLLLAPARLPRLPALATLAGRAMIFCAAEETREIWGALPPTCEVSRIETYLPEPTLGEELDAAADELPLLGVDAAEDEPPTAGPPNGAAAEETAEEAYVPAAEPLPPQGETLVGGRAATSGEAEALDFERWIDEELERTVIAPPTAAAPVDDSLTRWLEEELERAGTEPDGNGRAPAAAPRGGPATALDPEAAAEDDDGDFELPLIVAAPEDTARPEPAAAPAASDDDLVLITLEDDPRLEVGAAAAEAAPAEVAAGEPAALPAWHTLEASLGAFETPIVTRPREPREEHVRLVLPSRSPRPAFRVADVPRWLAGLPAGDILPAAAPARETLARAAAIAALAYGAYYLAWRWTATVAWDAAWFSVPLALAETLGYAGLVLLVVLRWSLKRRPAAPDAGARTADVFVTARADAPVDAVRETLRAALEMPYPHETHLLDDARRPELAELAREVGCGYVTRDGFDNGIAGLHNQALRQSSGELVLLLDAEHAPLPQMLHRMAGHFDDARLGLVQAPTDYIAAAAPSAAMSPRVLRGWRDERARCSVELPGLDAHDATPFLGSCALVRRATLEALGGFPSRTERPELEFSLLLHAGGWRSAYVAENLAYRLGGADAQRREAARARGAMQVLRTLNPLSLAGLSPAQRLAHFAAAVEPVHGLRKLVLYAAPVVFLLTGALPVRFFDAGVAARVLAFLALNALALSLLGRGRAGALAREREHMQTFWPRVRAIAALLSPPRPRAAAGGPRPGAARVALPQMALAGVSGAALLWAVVATQAGWVAYAVPGSAVAAFVFAAAWAAYNAGLAALTVLQARAHAAEQAAHSLERFPIRVCEWGPEGQRSPSYVAVAERLGAAGLVFRASQELNVGAGVRLTLALTTGTAQVMGRVVNAVYLRRARPAAFQYEVEYSEMSATVREMLELHYTQQPTPGMLGAPASGAQEGGAALGARVQSLLGGERRRMRLPVRLLARGAGEAEPAEYGGFIEQLDGGSARVLLETPLPPGTRVSLQVPGAILKTSGETIACRHVDSPVGARFLVGIVRDPAGSAVG